VRTGLLVKGGRTLRRPFLVGAALHPALVAPRVPLGRLISVRGDGPQAGAEMGTSVTNMIRLAIRFVVIGVAVLGLGACQEVKNYLPLLDRAEVPHGRDLPSDIEECRDYAAARDPAADTWWQLANGALVGGTLGLLAGAMLGSPGWGITLGTAYGSVVWYFAGMTGGAVLQQQIIIRCLAGRGYSVLAP